MMCAATAKSRSSSLWRTRTSASSHRSRVRIIDPDTDDIHDRVNMATTRSFLAVDAEAKTITLELEIDTTIIQVMHYFEIFLKRMIMCRRAAEFFGCAFSIVENGVRLL